MTKTTEHEKQQKQQQQLPNTERKRDNTHTKENIERKKIK